MNKTKNKSCQIRFSASHRHFGNKSTILQFVRVTFSFFDHLMAVLRMHVQEIFVTIKKRGNWQMRSICQIFGIKPRIYTHRTSLSKPPNRNYLLHGSPWQMEMENERGSQKYLLRYLLLVFTEKYLPNNTRNKHNIHLYAICCVLYLYKKCT